MPESVFGASLERVAEYCAASGQKTASVTFHGGEPLLVGARRMATWAKRFRDTLSDNGVRLRLGIQTNATLLNDEWIRVFRDFEFRVGVSYDGPRDIHDAHRLYRDGRGSHSRVSQGMALLRRGGIPLNILTVISLGMSGQSVHEHILSLGAQHVNYLLPDHNHQSIGPIRELHGGTPVADFLLPILRVWMSDRKRIHVPLFEDIAKMVLGGLPHTDIFGTTPLNLIFIETDGSIEGLDVLRVAENGASWTGLNVIDDRLDQLDDPRSAIMFQSRSTPSQCRGCPEEHTCAGGYLPHRFSPASGYDNPSVWCADIQALFNEVREHFNIPPQLTVIRREELNRIAMSRGSYGHD